MQDGREEGEEIKGRNLRARAHVHKEEESMHVLGPRPPNDGQRADRKSIISTSFLTILAPILLTFPCAQKTCLVPVTL